MGGWKLEAGSGGGVEDDPRLLVTHGISNKPQGPRLLTRLLTLVPLHTTVALFDPGVIKPFC
jgi:hypothetical protein